jgi:hypothetical protein
LGLDAWLTTLLCEKIVDPKKLKRDEMWQNLKTKAVTQKALFCQ